MNSKFTLIKKIAKHGNQAIIVIPKILEDQENLVFVWGFLDAQRNL